MYITTFGLWLIAIFVVIIVYKLYSLEIKINEHENVINNHYSHIKAIENDLYEDVEEISEEIVDK